MPTSKQEYDVLIQIGKQALSNSHHLKFFELCG